MSTVTRGLLVSGMQVRASLSGFGAFALSVLVVACRLSGGHDWQGVFVSDGSQLIVTASRMQLVYFDGANYGASDLCSTEIVPPQDRNLHPTASPSWSCDGGTRTLAKTIEWHDDQQAWVLLDERDAIVGTFRRVPSSSDEALTSAAAGAWRDVLPVDALRRAEFRVQDLDTSWAAIWDVGMLGAETETPIEYRGRDYSWELYRFPNKDSLRSLAMTGVYRTHAGVVGDFLLIATEEGDRWRLAGLATVAGRIDLSYVARSGSSGNVFDWILCKNCEDIRHLKWDGHSLSPIAIGDGTYVAYVSLQRPNAAQEAESEVEKLLVTPDGIRLDEIVITNGNPSVAVSCYYSRPHGAFTFRAGGGCLATTGQSLNGEATWSFEPTTNRWSKTSESGVVRVYDEIDR